MPVESVVLKHCGAIDPWDIRSFLARDGFSALKKALNQMTPDEVVEEVAKSELKGRGGAGFPCGIKWRLARKAPASEKFIICNADESEMGAFKDHYIMTHDPFTLIEAIGLAAYAVGAGRAYIYLRGEYHHILELLKNAVSQARAQGVLDHVIIEIQEGAGAYVCGEESALMDSIEGRRGEARFKPPFPPARGLWLKPTVINNVETLMNIPPIVSRGARWFKNMGTPQSRGTKVFSVSGDVRKPGTYELVMGSSLRELVDDLAGAEDVEMVQVGGAAGRIIPRPMLDTPLSSETTLGSGAVVVFNQSRHVIDIVYRDMEFLAEESCGKCTPCREGTEVMLEIYERLMRGEGEPEDLTALEELAEVMSVSSLCGLGQAAPIPVMDSLTHYRQSYLDRIELSMRLRSLGAAS